MESVCAVVVYVGVYVIVIGWVLLCFRFIKSFAGRHPTPNSLYSGEMASNKAKKVRMMCVCCGGPRLLDSFPATSECPKHTKQ